jgi:hypothetical protein
MTVFMLLSPTAHWQALPRDERDTLLTRPYFRIADTVVAAEHTGH